MDLATWVLVLAALALVLLAGLRERETLVLGLEGTRQAVIRFLPLFVAIFFIIGFSDVLVPKELISRWLSDAAGFRAIAIASALGVLMPGRPFVSYPIIATLYENGAGASAVVAYVTAWSLWSLPRLPMEFGVLGPRLTLARLASTALFPLLAGLIARLLFLR